MKPRRLLFACALALWAGTATADDIKLSNDDLCGTSLLGDEGSEGRSDEAWNKRLEEFFRGGGGLAMRSGRIEHEGPAGGEAVAWFGPPAHAGTERAAGEAWVPSDHLHVTRYEVAGSTVIEISVEQSPYVSSTVFAWFARGKADAPLSGAAVEISNDSAQSDDNGYFIRIWNERATGSITLERPRWPRSGGSRLAVDLTYVSRRVGVTGEMRTLVAIDRVPEGDPRGSDVSCATPVSFAFRVFTRTSIRTCSTTCGAKWSSRRRGR